ncbi:MAG: hypothetical protein CM15mV25_0850 [uncultured marine virus]|nr:MAG: hypothetical protein CM15mV25_0850 [uncultured marine virus]
MDNLPNRKKKFISNKVNLDLSHRCPLECLRCARQTYESDAKVSKRNQYQQRYNNR